ncbi:hypothetical protein Tco_1016310 [Tanacetum coccineum]|uniref:Uncharacterized protein n=1 Tax=Tanacetum coccineum TaxID=301880 RepID=A0ABQ5FPH2_9ASTR
MLTTFLTWLFIPVLLICMLNVETYIEAAKIVVKQGHAPDDITFVARAGYWVNILLKYLLNWKAHTLQMVKWDDIGTKFGDEENLGLYFN